MDTKRESPIDLSNESKPVASWASIFLDYVELKARLLARESKEASGHLIGLIVLTGVVLVLAIASVLMYGAFLLFAVALLLHLAWDGAPLFAGSSLRLPVGSYFLSCDSGFVSRFFE